MELSKAEGACGEPVRRDWAQSVGGLLSEWGEGTDGAELGPGIQAKEGYKSESQGNVVLELRCRLLLCSPFSTSSGFV